MKKPALPKKLPIKLDYSEFAKELSEASFELGKLDGLQRHLPNPSLLISPLITKEATISSKIEGTRSTISDVFMFQATKEKKYDDTIEVFNYRRAMFWAIKVLSYRKLNISFIKDLHNILLTGARGEEYKGKFREGQVFIGKRGDTIEDATYIPPKPILIQEYMENLEDYIINYQENPLIKSAIIHYQFEAIHPFEDGNGRIGRLIIPLYLYQEKMLYQPILFLSGYFERNRDQYIDSLNLVDTTLNYNQWIKFYLISVKNQSIETQKLIYQIKDLFEETRSKTESIKSPYILKIIDFMFSSPIFLISDLTKNIKANRVTCFRLIKKLETIKIVKSFLPSRKKRKLFIFESLIKLLS
ncbi:MAG: Fic family protein [Patescibacteria group bacterium]|nr:MAG: Fic family protein [Patescibacteria group bacterium]